MLIFHWQNHIIAVITTIKHKLQIYKEVFNPIFDYWSIIIYHRYSNYDTNYDSMRLQVLQNNFIRFICGLKKYDHGSERRNELKILNIYQIDLYF